MKKIIFTLIATIAILTTSFAQAAPGGIAFVGFNADGTDNFSFIVLQEIPAGQNIFFDENEWNGTMFNDANEGIVEWVNSTGASIAPGTVITISGNSTLTTTGGGTATVVAGSFNFGGSNEAVYAYLGTAGSPTIFLAALTNDDFASSGATLDGTGLVLGETALELDAIDADADVANYIGSTDCTGLDLTMCASMFNTVNATNWETFDGSGSQEASSNAPANSVDIPTTFGILPVDLTSFSARLNDKSTLLTWQTALEINNDFFQVEYSTNGADFEMIGEERGYGESFELKTYTFTHYAPTKGMNYYRLKQVDFDGRFEYSNVVIVEMLGKGVSIYPNPATDVINVQVEAEEARVEIFNINGQLIQTQVLNSGTVEIANLIEGQYILKVISGNDVMTETFVKQ